MSLVDFWRTLANGVRLAPLLAAVLSAVAAEPANPLQLRAHHITAAVTDIDRAVKWYQQVLGFRLVERGKRNGGAFRFAELEIPGFGVALVQLAGAQAAPAGDKPLAPDWVHIVFAVPDPQTAYAELKLRGADVFTRGPATPPITTFLLHDSEGNEIEIADRKFKSPLQRSLSPVIPVARNPRGLSAGRTHPCPHRSVPPLRAPTASQAHAGPPRRHPAADTPPQLRVQSSGHCAGGALAPSGSSN